MKHEHQGCCGRRRRRSGRSGVGFRLRSPNGGDTINGVASHSQMVSAGHGKRDAVLRHGGFVGPSEYGFSKLTPYRAIDGVMKKAHWELISCNGIETTRDIGTFLEYASG